MQDINVLWVDDDSPTKNKDVIDKLRNQVKGINVFTANSCEQAEILLASMPSPPQWAIVDLIVPQGDWQTKYYKVPGIQYIKHLKEKYGNNINIYAFSVMINNEIENKVKAVGGIDAFVKSNISLVGVLEKIKNNSKPI